MTGDKAGIWSIATELAVHPPVADYNDPLVRRIHDELPNKSGVAWNGLGHLRIVQVSELPEWSDGLLGAMINNAAALSVVKHEITGVTLATARLDKDLDAFFEEGCIREQPIICTEEAQSIFRSLIEKA